MNRFRGEVALTVDGVPQVMRLTLGALVWLEDRLGEGSLLALVERFEQSRFSSRDVILLLAAGLKGGGSEMGEARLMQAEIAGGPVAAARAAAELLARAFTVPE
ncbi:MAG: gene transfer agent family protein [Sulfitobacter sp.]|nr:gene transfer agent family protein [Sulfitobacter sp.]